MGAVDVGVEDNVVEVDGAGVEEASGLASASFINRTSCVTRLGS